MKLSVIIPAHDEAGCIAGTVTGLHRALADAGIEHEIIVVDDHSADDTAALVVGLIDDAPTVRLIVNDGPAGFGMAIRAGLAAYEGDCVALFMADSSDDPHDLVAFYRAMVEHGVECVFGTRFSGGGRVIAYPAPKLALNRFANVGIRLMLGLRYDDVTNAFKLYRREVIDGISPLLSRHFNLTVEMPLKAIVRGYSYAVVPNTWTNRASGVSKFDVPEMGSRYAFIVLYCCLEKWLSRGDYRRLSERASPGRSRATETV